MPPGAAVNTAVRIGGLQHLLRACEATGGAVEEELRAQLLIVGEETASDVRFRYAPYSEVGAATVIAKLLPAGLYVVQTLEKSRDMLKRRPNFGPKMMRKAFLPAVRDNEDRLGFAAAAAVAKAEAALWTF